MKSENRGDQLLHGIRYLQVPKGLPISIKLSIFRVFTADLDSTDGFVSVRYVKWANLVELLAEIPASVCFCCSTDYERDHKRNLQTAKRKESLPALVEPFGVDRFSSVLRSIHAVRTKYKIQMFTATPRCPQKRLYANVDDILHIFTKLVPAFHVWNVYMAPCCRILQTLRGSIFIKTFTKDSREELQ